MHKPAIPWGMSALWHSKQAPGKVCCGFRAHEFGPSPCFAANCHEICSLVGCLAEAGEEPALGDGPSAKLREVGGKKTLSGGS